MIFMIEAPGVQLINVTLIKQMRPSAFPASSKKKYMRLFGLSLSSRFFRYKYCDRNESPRVLASNNSRQRALRIIKTFFPSRRDLSRLLYNHVASMS